VIGRPVAGIDLGGLTEAQLARLATFVAGIDGASALATLGVGLAVALPVLFWPSREPTGKWVKVGGPGSISYFLSPSEPKLTIRYTTANGVPQEWSGAPDPNGNYRGPNGQVIARLVKTAAKAGIVVSTAALLGNGEEGPKLCPAAQPDRGGSLGQAYENFVKAQFNPGNPTPPGFAYKFFDPATGQSPVIDDCQQKSGILAEYKGPGYAKHLLKKDLVWEAMERKMLKQAYSQVQAKGTRPLIWFVDEKPLADHLEKEFEPLKLPIDVDWLPMKEND
jgi:hypothetical protein